VEWVETTGRTLEEAKDAALDQLGVDEQDAEFEILEEPKTGLFGRIRAEARVRARVRPTRPRPKEDRRDRRRRQQRTGKADGNGSTNGRESEAPAPQAARGSRPARRGGEKRDTGDKRDKEEVVSEDVSLAEQGEVARTFVAGLVEQFGVQGTVELREVDEETVEVAVSGGNLGLLIGPKGATLSALQEVTRTVVQRQTGGRNGRIVVDVAGYRQKRREALERFTHQVAEQVKATGERRVLEPMHPADRKVVHDTANTIDGVSTTSEGEEPRRRVVILPS
jgi:spoIIIJ-associated protein